jgi:hypothetical protein
MSAFKFRFYNIFNDDPENVDGTLDYTDSETKYPNYFVCIGWPLSVELPAETYLNACTILKQQLRDEFKSIEFFDICEHYFAFADQADAAFYQIWAIDRIVEIEI